MRDVHVESMSLKLTFWRLHPHKCVFPIDEQSFRTFKKKKIATHVIHKKNITFNYKIINFPKNIYVRYAVIRNVNFYLKVSYKRFTKRLKLFLKLNCLLSINFDPVFLSLYATISF